MRLGSCLYFLLIPPLSMAEVHRDDTTTAMGAIIAVIVIALIIGLGIYAYNASGGTSLYPETTSPAGTSGTTDGTTGGVYESDSSSYSLSSSFNSSSVTSIDYSSGMINSTGSFSTSANTSLSTSF